MCGPQQGDFLQLVFQSANTNPIFGQQFLHIQTGIAFTIGDSPQLLSKVTRVYAGYIHTDRDFPQTLTQLCGRLVIFTELLVLLQQWGYLRY